MTNYILTAYPRSCNPVIAKLSSEIEYTTAKNQKYHLNFLSAQKIARRLLTCDRLVTKEIRVKKLTKKELAKELSLDLSELNTLLNWPSKAFYGKITSRVSLALVKLYCNAKFIEDT